MAAKLIYVTDDEFNILSNHLKMGGLAFDSINLENKITFMRDKFEGKSTVNKKDYVNGFCDGLSSNKEWLLTITTLGKSLTQIYDLIIKNEEIEMPTKQFMTREEAIVCFKEHMPWTGNSAEKAIDFYIATGMLDVKEELETKIMLRDTDGDLQQIYIDEIKNKLLLIGYQIIPK